MHSTIDAQLPQKVPKQKTCQTPRKWAITVLSSIKLYYSKKMWNFIFNYMKNDLHHQKAYNNLCIRHLNSLFISQIVFALFAVKNAFLPTTQSLLRHFGPIFTFKTAITQRLFEGSKNCWKKETEMKETNWDTLLIKRIQRVCGIGFVK
jgi:hypothetical protein